MVRGMLTMGYRVQGRDTCEEMEELFEGWEFGFALGQSTLSMYLYGGVTKYKDQLKSPYCLELLQSNDHPHVYVNISLCESCASDQLSRYSRR